jgi:hypothetical protein
MLGPTKDAKHVIARRTSCAEAISMLTDMLSLASTSRKTCFPIPSPRDCFAIARNDRKGNDFQQPLPNPGDYQISIHSIPQRHQKLDDLPIDPLGLLQG